MIYICLVLTAIFIIRNDAFEENTTPYRLTFPEALHNRINKRTRPNCAYVCFHDPEPTPLSSIGGTDVKPRENDPFSLDSYFMYKRLYKPLYGKLFGFGDKPQTRPKLAQLPFNLKT